MEIIRLEHQDPTVQAQIRDYLAADEVHNLFILGNLRSSRPAQLYVAVENGRWWGIAAIYATYRSLIPFSKDEAVVRQLIRHLLATRRPIEYLNGIDYAAAPAYAEMLDLGYQPTNAPHQVFMELEGQPPPQPGEEACRLMRSEDGADVARAVRSLGDGNRDPDAPILETELSRMATNPDRWVLVCDGKVVATAGTSGMGIEACQIIGVATHPQYRRRGFARAVCAHLIREMARRGARRSILFTGVENVFAQRCYEGLGFRTTGKYYVAKFRVPAGAEGAPGATGSLPSGKSVATA